MTAGPWHDGPDPISGSTTFTDSDFGPRTYSDPDPKFGGVVAELDWSPTWSVLSNVLNSYSDGDPRYQQVWDMLRGFDPSDVTSGLLYTGNASVPNLVDPWFSRLKRIAIEATGANSDQFISMVHRLTSTLSYTVDPWPPGAIGLEYGPPSEAASCVGTISIDWDHPPQTNPDTGIPFPDMADIGGMLLAPMDLPSGDVNYPYNDLAGLIPTPSDMLAFTDQATVSAFPDALLNLVAPPAFVDVVTEWWANHLRFTVDFAMTFPRYRFIFADIPERRLFPRPSTRVYPPQPTVQDGRRFGSSSIL